MPETPPPPPPQEDGEIPRPDFGEGVMGLPKPFYEDTRAGITIYCGDCRDILPHLPKVDLVLTDPPYGINHPTDYAYRGRAVLAPCRNYAPVFDDDKPFDPRFLLSFGQARILWGGNYFAPLLPTSGGWLVWDKERPDELDQATCELAWTDCVKGVRRFRHMWNGMIRASDDNLVHPTQKPEALMKWCMSLRWTKDFISVCDPYMGSGTTLRAAKDLGRKAIGIEISEEYFRIAVKRLEQQILPLSFDSIEKPSVSGDKTLRSTEKRGIAL
jgi:site-specific DNA-methyltransferase (adenine-specific)